jgi:hypothetical protein
MSQTLDRIDGGIPTVFLDGPKKGQTGVVTPSVHGQPPERLMFLPDNSLVYLRRGRTVLTGRDEITGKRRRLKGVTYQMDPQCSMALELAAYQAGEAAKRGEMGVQA